MKSARQDAYFCPGCGEQSFQRQGVKALQCERCGFLYFHNVATAVAGILRVGKEICFTVRGRDPARGRLDFAGGFVDPCESLEGALVREVREELSLQLASDDPVYLFSYWNDYAYAGITYHTTDVYFRVDVGGSESLEVADDVAGVQWWQPEDVPDEHLAFASVRWAVDRLRTEPALLPDHGSR